MGKRVCVDGPKGCTYESHIHSGHAKGNIFEKGGMAGKKEAYEKRESSEMEKGTNRKY